MASFVKFLGIEANEVSAKEKLVSAIGGFTAILLLVLLTHSVLNLNGAVMLIASMGASAVLLFAVPHGPLSQPWPVIGGHVISALIGVAVSRSIGSVELAAAVAVGASIGAMHLLRCIHPPGGATALSAVIGGANVHALGYVFVLRPVLLNAVAMVAFAVCFNAAFPWRRYPAAWTRPDGITDELVRSHDDVLAALRSIDSFIDVDERDLLRLADHLSKRQPAPADEPDSVGYPDRMITGRCLCEAVTFELTGDIIATAVCHCDRCQRQGGSAFSVNLVAHESQLKVNGELKTFEERGERKDDVYVRRKFCPGCGSPIVSELAKSNGIIAVKAGVLDDKSSVNPTVEAWCVDRQPWVSLPGMAMSMERE